MLLLIFFAIAVMVIFTANGIIATNLEQVRYYDQILTKYQHELIVREVKMYQRESGGWSLPGQKADMDGNPHPTSNKYLIEDGMADPQHLLVYAPSAYTSGGLTARTTTGLANPRLILYSRTKKQSNEPGIAYSPIAGGYNAYLQMGWDWAGQPTSAIPKGITAAGNLCNSKNSVANADLAQAEHFCFAPDALVTSFDSGPGHLNYIYQEKLAQKHLLAKFLMYYSTRNPYSLKGRRFPAVTNNIYPADVSLADMVDGNQCTNDAGNVGGVTPTQYIDLTEWYDTTQITDPLSIPITCAEAYSVWGIWGTARHVYMSSKKSMVIYTIDPFDNTTISTSIDLN